MLPNDEAPAVAAVEAPGESKQDESPNFDASGLASGAELVIRGEQMAREYLATLTNGMARPGDLPAAIAVLSLGARNTLYGYCRVIEKALGGVGHE